VSDSEDVISQAVQKVMKGKIEKASLQRTCNGWCRHDVVCYSSFQTWAAVIQTTIITTAYNVLSMMMCHLCLIALFKNALLFFSYVHNLFLI